MTNGDKIRNMTDEELVEAGLIECPKIYRNCTTKKSCDECKKEYLAKEADDAVYDCDPTKNKECTKTGCYINGGECTKTTKKEFARDKNLFDELREMALKNSKYKDVKRREEDIVDICEESDGKESIQ